eukprot:7065580-Prymnesium_polylepis.1
MACPCLNMTGTKLTARILWIAPEEKRVALTLVQHLVACAPFAPPSSAAVGAVLPAAVGFQVIA